MNSDILVTFPGGKRVAAHLGAFAIPIDPPSVLSGEATAPSFEVVLANDTVPDAA